MEEIQKLIVKPDSQLWKDIKVLNKRWNMFDNGFGLLS